MNDILNSLYALRPSLVLSLAAAASLALIAWGGISVFADSADAAGFSW
jgi:hypothetical protein